MPDTINLRDFSLREEVQPSDRDAVRRLVEATGFFRPDEVEVAVELVDTRLEKGEPSGYEFLFAEESGRMAGYACYGPIACALGAYDLYWIAVEPAFQGRGLGRALLNEVERRVESRSGRHVYIETSGRPQYEPTRAFYRRCGYELAAVLEDFYDRGDAKLIWRKPCGPRDPSS
jgi:ribosomal protein S18 acetylase RimI-like enzyme